MISVDAMWLGTGEKFFLSDWMYETIEMSFLIGDCHTQIYIYDKLQTYLMMYSGMDFVFTYAP